jgi:ABC-2 type transport system ATP-binding protein
MIEGFRRPDSGQIDVLGRDPVDREAAWLDWIGIVLQQSGIEDELTVAEAIAAQRRSYGKPMSVAEAMDTVDLTEKASARIRSLSGGQRRRLDLALGISATRSCCSSTSRPPDSTLRRGDGPGRQFESSPTQERQSS